MGLTKPIEQNSLNFQGTFMYPKDIIRGGTEMKYEIKCGAFPIVVCIKRYWGQNHKRFYFYCHSTLKNSYFVVQHRLYG